MWSTQREIAAGDVVIVWMTRENLQPLVVTPGKELNNKYGYYRHEDFIGVPYGSKVGARNKKGFVHLLRPTPELWTLSLPHRTQILYLADIAFVTSWLNIKPGSRVVEAGTGSGSFSHSTARTIGPTGHLYSYEFHEARAAKAREEFSRHGLANITLTHRNVCKEGFTVADAADAVFLDLPAPWDAVAHAKTALRKDRVSRICCFSPCIEQVLRTVAALNAAGFSDITMHESLVRPHDVSAPPLPMPTVGSAADRLRTAERKREDRRKVQIANARARNAAAAASASAPAPAPASVPSNADGEAGAGTKRKHPVEAEDATAVPEAAPANSTEDADPDAPPAEGSLRKRVRTAEPDDATGPASSSGSGSGAGASAKIAAKTAWAEGKKARPLAADGGAGARRTVLSKAFAEVRGHTSYLTFACLVPRSEGAPAAAAVPAPAADAVVAEIGEVQMQVDTA